MKTSKTLLPSQMGVLLERLGKMFVWRRKALVQEVRTHLTQAESEHGALLVRHRKLQGKAASLRSRLRHEVERAEGIWAALTQTRTTLDIVQERYGLVSRLLAAKPALDGGIAHYRKALEEDYLAFASEESTLADAALAYRMLKSVEAQLELIANEPGIYTRKILSIAGGFSSGKSAFINSFIEAPEIELAVGMRPVTAIPTYVWNAPNSAIKAHAKAGGAIDLDAQLFRNISHEFLKSLGFDLKDIMSFISIATPMTQSRFDHLCLLDTPGYNPPRTDGYTGADMTTASSFSAQANAVLWLIGLDSTGTLVSSDLEFIHGLDLAGKEFYVVANKADLRGPTDIEDILNDIEGLLIDEGIPFVGVSAYSADRKREYAFRGESLHDFFARHNEPVDARAALYETIDQVFEMYRAAIARDIDAARQSQRTFKSMYLDLQQHASDELIALLGEKFASLKHAEREAQLREHLKSAHRTKARMKAAVHEALCAAGVRFADELSGDGHFEDPRFEDIDAIPLAHRDRMDAVPENPDAPEEAAATQTAGETADAAPNPDAPKWSAFFRQFLGAPQADAAAPGQPETNAQPEPDPPAASESRTTPWFFPSASRR